MPPPKQTTPTGSKPTTPRGGTSGSAGAAAGAAGFGLTQRHSPTRNSTPSPNSKRRAVHQQQQQQPQQHQQLSPSARERIAEQIRKAEGSYHWEKEKQALVKLSSEQLMRRALKMHFEILDLRQGAALLSDQASVMHDHMTQLELRSVSPSQAVDPSQSPQRASPSPGHRRLTAQVAESIKQISSLHRAIEGGLGVIGPVSPRRIPLIEPDPALTASGDDVPPERRLDNSVVLLSQAVHHLLAQAFVLAEAVSEAQAASSASPGRAAEYMALRAAVSAGEKEIEAENSRSSRLQKQLDAMDETVRCLRAARGDLQDSVNVSFQSLQDKQEQLQQQNTELQIRLRDVELERARAQEELQRWRDDATELRERVDELQQSGARLESESSMNKFLLDEARRELGELVEAMGSSSNESAGAVHLLRQQLEHALAANAQYQQQLRALQAEGPLVTEAALVQAVEMADCESAELEDRVEVQAAYYDRLLELRLRFQRNQMQRQLNELVARNAELEAQRNDDLDALARRDAEQSALSEEQLARLGREKDATAASVRQLQAKLIAAVSSSAVGEREELRRQQVLMDSHFEVAQTMRDLTFSSLRDLDASYATVANQNDRMELMQARIDQLEHDKHDTKELRVMLDSAQKAFSTADSEAAKLLQYLGQAREEIARLSAENKRVVDEANERTAQLEDATAAAQEAERRAVDGLNAANERNEKLETLVAELEQKLERIIAELEERLRHAFAEKEELEKRLAEASAALSQRAEASEESVAKMRADLAAATRSAVVAAEAEEARARALLDGEQAAAHSSLSATRDGEASLLALLEHEVRGAVALRGELAALRSEHETVRAEHDALHGAHDALRTEHDAVRAELDSLRGQHETLRGENATLRGELDALRDAERSLSSDRDAQISQLSARESSLAAAKDALTAAERALAELRREHDALFARTAATEEDLRARLRAVEEELAQQRAAAERQAREQADAAALLASERDELQRQLDATRDDMSQSQNDVARRFSASEAALAAEKARHSETQAQLEKEKKRLEEALAALEAERQRVRDRDAEIASLRGDASEEMDKMRDQIDELNRQLGQARVGALQSESEAQKQIADLSQQVQRLEARLAGAQEAADRRERDLLAELAQASKDLQAERQQSAALRSNSTASASDAQRAISELQCQIIDLQTKLEAAQLDSEALRRQLEAGDAGAAQLRAALDEKTRLLADATARNEQLTAQLAKVTASRDRLKAALKDAVALQDQLSRIAEIQDANQRLAFENSTLQQQLDELRAAAADAEKQVMMSRSEFSKLEQAVAAATAAEEDLARALAGDAAPQLPPTQSASAQHEAIQRAARTMGSAAAAVLQLHAGGSATVGSVQALMKLVDTLHTQLGMPQPLLAAPTSASNAARGVDSVNAALPPVMGRVREVMFKAQQLQQQLLQQGGGGSGRGALTPLEQVEQDEHVARQDAAAAEADDFNELMEELVLDLQEKAATEGAKVRRAMDMLEEAQFAMRGRVGSEKLLNALDLLRSTPGAKRGAALSMLQQRVKRGGTVILNLNEFDPKYKSIAWLVSTRGALVDHLGDVFRALFAIPYQHDKTQKSLGTVMGTFLTSIEKMHLGLPPYLLSMETVHVREASEKELSRILVTSSMSASHPTAADSPECSPARYMRDGNREATSAAIAHSQFMGTAPQEASPEQLRRAMAAANSGAAAAASADSIGSPMNASLIARVAMHDASIMTDDALSTPPRAPPRAVVKSWGSPPPPPAFNVFY